MRPRQERCHCPVPGFPAADPLRSAGWKGVASMRNHLEEHAGGRLQGDILAQLLEDNMLGQCVVCSKMLHRRFGNACPRCRPQVQSPTPERQSRPMVDGCPDIAAIFEAKVRLKTHIPKGARQMWSLCLLAALAEVVEHNDMRAWADLLALPKLVLKSHIHGGRSNRRRAEAETQKTVPRVA